MTEPIHHDPAAVPPARDQLLELGRLLRESGHLGPDARRELADLVEELAGTLTPDAPSAQTTHLAETTAHLVQALHDQHDAGPLALARERLEDAVARVDARAPVATGLARRIVDLLADLGI
jgi:hypothetical protein